ncbi:MAG: sugar ABC transporter substrate-binding protein [Eubacteriales bacterium]|nr:sugar ABC transporter substrate-binding protein [Eubacteriales bacterium]
MNKKKILSVGSVLLAVCFLGFGAWTCRGERVFSDGETEAGDAKANAAELVIGCTLASGESNYQEALGNLMQDFAEKDGSYTLDIRYAAWSVETQEQQMRDFIEEGVDAIILCPVNAKSFLGVLKEASQHEIPVINLNMKVDLVSTEYVAAYVGASMSEEAEMAASLAIDYFDGAEGKIGIIEGLSGSDPQIYRTQTFLEKLTSHPNIEVVGIAGGEWEKDKAKEAARELLVKCPEINLMYCHDNYMSQGVYELLEELGKTEEIGIIGIGSASEHMEDVREGRLVGLVTQPPEVEAYYALECAKKGAMGEELQSWYKNIVQIITKENVDEYRSPLEAVLS